MFQEIEIFLILEGGELVFFCYTPNSRYHNVEVHLKLLIFQSNFSGPR